MMTVVSSPPEPSEVILLADDEPAIRRLMRRALETHGYRVLEAQHGEEALAVAGRHDGRIPLLITDIVMPRMNGFELAQHLMRSRQELQVLYVSGYGDRPAVQQALRDSQRPFLLKPYTQADFTRTVRRILETPSP